MAKMIQVPYDNNIIIPVMTAQAVQKNTSNPISLDALGLLVNLLSYPTSWELHKTELYKRFEYHGERSTMSAWKSLMNSNYIIEFKYRIGKKWEYEYYFRKVPFTDDEKKEILQNAEKMHGRISTLDFEESKQESTECGGNQKTLLNKNNILNINNNYIVELDDDKRLRHNEMQINSIISNLKEQTKDQISARSFDSVVRKVIDKYNQGKVNNFRDYLVTAITNKINELETKRIKNAAKKEIQSSRRPDPIQKSNSNHVFYDWVNN